MSNYTSAEQAETLIAGGDIRCLDDEIGEPEYFDEAKPAAELKSVDDLLEFARNCGAQHIYVFDDGAWEHRKL